MSRSLKKGLYINEKLLKKINAQSAGSKNIIKTWDRASMIAPEMVGFTIAVHNGREHLAVYITEQMVGHRLGEFAPTRKFVRHGGRMARDEQKTEGAKEQAKLKE